MSGTAPKSWDLFLSYHSRDHALATELAYRLRGEGLQPWFDKWELIPGEPWLPAVEHGIAESPCMVVCIGASGWGPVQDAEAQNARIRAMLDRKRRVIPVFMAGVEQVELPGLLKNLAYVDLRGGSDEEFRRLALAIRGLAAGPRPATVVECPYRGLQPFESQHAWMFFGRLEDVSGLLDRLRRAQRLLLIVGPSGSGKSSLVMAGLLPAVASGQLHGSYDWRVVSVRPGARPCHELAVALGSLEETPPPDGVTRLQALRRSLREDPESLTDQVDLLLQQQPRTCRLLLLVDQLEEVFSQCQDRTDRDAFLANLVHAGTIAGGRVHVVATLRSDFLGRLQEWPGIAGQLNDATYLMRSMAEDELRETLTRPAQLSGLRFEPGLIEELVSAVRAQPGDLPLLQFTLLQLWKERQGETLTWEAYERIRRLQGAIARSAEQCLSTLTERQQSLVPRVFRRLVIVGDETGDTRRRASREELEALGAEVPILLERFISARLLVASDGRVELAHEALVRGWERLREWLEEERELLMLRQEVERASEAWRRSGQSTDELWRGSRMARAGELEDALAPLLTEGERAFLHESREALRREAERAELAVARMLAMRSAQVRPHRPMLSLLLAREAVSRYSHPETRSELYAALLGSPLREVIPLAGRARTGQSLFRPSPDGATFFVCSSGMAALLSRAGKLIMELPVKSLDVKFVRFSPDGERLAVIPSHGVKGIAAWLFSARGELISTLRDGGSQEPTNCASFSPDGQRLLTARSDGAVRLWNVALCHATHLPTGGGFSYGYFSPDGTRLLTLSSESRTANLWSAEGERLQELEGHKHRIIHGSWSPDGTHVLTSARDDTARVWDRDGNSIATLTGHTAPLTHGAFDPSGSRVLTVSEDSTARLWDLTGKSLLILRDAPQALEFCSWSPQGRHFLTWNQSRLRIYRDSGRLLTTLQEHEVPGRYHATWSSDGASLMTSHAGRHDEDGPEIQVWAVEPAPTRVLQGHRGEIQHVVPQPAGGRILTVSLDCVCLWNAQGTLLHRIEREDQPTDRTPLFTGACWDPQGRMFLTYGYNSLVRGWDADGQPLLRLEGQEQHQLGIHRARFSTDGSRILTVSNDGSARLWSLEGRELVRMGDHYWGVDSGEVSPTGHHALTVSAHRELYVWDLRPPFINISEAVSLFGAYSYASGECALEQNGSREAVPTYPAARLLHRSHRPLSSFADIDNAHFVPGSPRIVLLNKGIHCLDLETGESRALAPGHRASCGAVNPDGTRILLGYDQGHAEVRNFDGNVLWQLRGHEAAVGKVGWTPDGARAFTAAEDGTVCLWEPDGSLLATLRGHIDPLTDVTFDGRGEHLLTTAGTVAWSWPATREGLKALAEQRPLRDFTPQERQRYLE
ncbi:TIR domain-containing protein [Corallococcus exercitus]|uniref:TIR domain-containing protein n=1 Tax=Corallococcus exercitus TaxID=2316736 RepID=A0A7Y4KE60_9BACT|nr:TIR domain-containing protein [Corallococcus exercitus]NOK32022.1 TIR domain-containing protein [Corallococcus exercitus]